MQIKYKFTDTVALALVALIIFGLPAVIWWYEKAYLPSRYPEGTVIINLTARAPEDGCLWTEDNINAFNYWWKKFKFAEEIAVTQGAPVVFRIKSSDLLHSFAIPRFRIGPYEVEAGKVKEVQFLAERAGKFKYLCWLWCSDCHGDLSGKIVVSTQE